MLGSRELFYAIDCLLKSINFESTTYFHRLASISLLRGREQGVGWWAWELSPGKEEVGGLEGL